MKSKKVLILVSIVGSISGLMGCNNSFTSSGSPVERVSDGDTLVVKDANGKNLNVRFACVDAPEIAHTNQEKSSKLASERNQFNWGIKAKARVEQLVKAGGDRVILKITDSDQYGRKVAEVYLKDGTFIQQVLIQEGLAKAYRPYLNKCPSQDLVLKTEQQAQQQKLGIWNDRKFVNPWDYRRLKKNVARNSD